MYHHPSLPFLLALCLCIAPPHVHAHNWLTSPIPRGGVKDNTASPCEALTASSKVSPAWKGEGMLVTWTDNHQDNNVHALGIAQYGEDGSTTDFTSLYSVKSGSTSYELPASTFAGYAVGSMYTLRYTWSTWDNCATLRIAAPAPAGSVSADAANITVSPVDNQPVRSGDYIIMDKSAAVGVFNVYNEQTTCKSGYAVKSKSCVPKGSSGIPSGDGGSGMSGGGKAALSLFIIFLACVAAFAGFSYYKHNDPLFYARPLIDKAKNKRASRYSTPADTTSASRNTGNYTAYVEPEGEEGDVEADV